MVVKDSGIGSGHRIFLTCDTSNMYAFRITGGLHNLIPFAKIFASRPLHNRAIAKLVFAVVAGLLSGSCLSLNADSYAYAAMLSASGYRVSFGGLIAVLILPVVFSLFAVYTSQVWLIYLTGFIKAFLSSFIGTGLILSSGDSGWLLRMLLMFSDFVSLPVLCWLWMHISTHGRSSNLRSTAIVFLVMGGIGFMDYYYISPFLANLIT